MAAALQHPARRIPRRLLAGAGRAAPGRRGRRARRRLAAAPRRAAGGSAGGGRTRSSSLRRWPGLAWTDAGSAGGARAGPSRPRSRRSGPLRRALAETVVQPAPDAARGRGCRRSSPGCRIRWRTPWCSARSRPSAAAPGLLYLANTAGAVCGSLAAGYLLLPRLGHADGGRACSRRWRAAAILPLWWRGASRGAGAGRGRCRPRSPSARWTAAAADYVLRRALVVPRGQSRARARARASTEVIAVVEAARGRALLTNGHAMSSTAPLDQRYMRALAHVPLLSMAGAAARARHRLRRRQHGPRGHAAPVGRAGRRRRAVARTCSAHAGLLPRPPRATCCAHPKVAVYLNDGRQHLQMVGARQLRSGHARAAADRARRRGRVVLARVLRAWSARASRPAVTSVSGCRPIRCPTRAAWRWCGRSSTCSPERCCCRARRPSCCSWGRRGRASRSIPSVLRQRLDGAPGVRAADLARARPRRSRARSWGRSSARRRRCATPRAGRPPVTDDRPIAGVRRAGRGSRPGCTACRRRCSTWMRCRVVVPALLRAAAGRCRRWPTSTPIWGCCAKPTQTPVAAVAAAAAARRGQRRFLGSPYLGTRAAGHRRGVQHRRRGRARPGPGGGRRTRLRRRRCGSSRRRRRRGRTSVRSGTSRGARCSRRGAFRDAAAELRESDLAPAVSRRRRTTILASRSPR